MNRFLTITLIILFVNSLQSQTKGFLNYSVDDDLQSSTVYFAMQDSKGYMWFATDNGISKFDGYEFKSYTTLDGLLSNTIFNIYEDYKGRIWFLSFNGKLCYYYNNKIEKYKYNKIISYEKNGLLTPPRNGFYVDTLDNIYISFNEKEAFFKIDANGKYTKIISPKETISIIAIDSNTTINSMRHAYKKVRIKINNKDSIYDILNNNFSVTNSDIRKNEIIFNTKKYVYSVKDGKLKLIYNNDNTIYFIKFWNNNIWVGTNKGAVLLQRNNEGKIYKLDTLLQSYKISTVVVDNEDGIWFTTLNNGVFYKPKSDIKKYYTELLDEDITDIYFTKNKTFIATYSNRFYIVESSKIKQIKLPSSVFIIKSIREYKDSAFIIVTPNILFYYKNGKLEEFSNHITIKNFIILRNKIYVGARYGFYSVDEKFNFHLILEDWINSSFALNDSIIIVAGKHGAYKVNAKTNNYEKIEINNNPVDIVTVNKYKNYILFGTKENGILLYNNKTMNLLSASEREYPYFNTPSSGELNPNRLKIINNKNGLSSNYIKDIKIYNKHIWVATNKGLNVINLENSTIEKPIIQSFYTTNGLISNTVNVLSIKDSILFIGTSKGVSYINIKQFTPKKFNLNVQISGVKINKKDTVVLNKYILDANDNNISINFIGISYNFQKRVKYKYRFQKIGEKPQWIYTNNTSVNLIELSSSKYIFEVYAIINNIESKQSAVVKFTITPYFWNTTVFKILIILIVFVIFLIIPYLFNKRNKQKHIEKLNIYKYQNQALINQINPHFIFNTLNSIQLYIYKNEKLKSAEYITKFSKLMRQVLDYSKTELITIAEEIEVIKSYVELERLRFDNKFDFKFNVDNKLLYKKILPLITQPYIENAIWHGLMLKETKGLLEIFIYEHENRIIIAIDDNGIGRKKAKELNSSKTYKKTSYGESIGVERINVFNKVYKQKAVLEIKDIINDDEVAGTRVLIKFPKL